MTVAQAGPRARIRSVAGLAVFLSAASCSSVDPTETAIRSPSIAGDPAPPSLVPWPAAMTVEVTTPPDGRFTETSNGARIADASDAELVRLSQWAPPGDRTVRLRLAPAAGDEAERPFPRRDETYRIAVSDSSVDLSARTHAGLFYALQTLRQLREASEAPPTGLYIEDGPRFGYRGMHLDVGRHLFPVPFIKQLIDEMARLKLNAFHWHLTEDQGWRIQIDAYPRLTEVGAWRRETMVEKSFDPYVGDGQTYGGYYTKDEVREVVAYAAARYVTVIPEIEMPGHSTAALAAYPEFSCTGGPIEVATTWGVHPDIYCPSEETFAFLETVLDEVIELFPGPYLHIGGDEAPKTRWEESDLAQSVMRREGLANEEELQSWFVRRIERFLNSRGKQLIGWDEILEGGLAPRATVMSWRGTAGGVEAARDGHDVIISPNADLYFDHYQGDPAHEPLAIGGLTTLAEVYAFDPIPAELEPELTHHVLGPQANVWTEYMPTTTQVEYMVFPRLIALAEVAWSPLAARDRSSFLGRLPARLAALEERGVGFRVPPPHGLDADIETAEQTATLVLDSLGFGTVRFTLDGSDPGPDASVAFAPLSLPTTQEGTVVSARRYSPGGRSSPLRRGVVRRTDR